MWLSPYKIPDILTGSEPISKFLSMPNSFGNGKNMEIEIHLLVCLLHGLISGMSSGIKRQPAPLFLPCHEVLCY